MRTFEVPTPTVDQLPSADRALGRLGPALRWLACAQGTWPPTAPQAVRRVVVGEAATPEDPIEAGARLADQIADGGGDLVLLSSRVGEAAGIVAAAALLDLEPVEAIGTAGAANWALLVVDVRNGLRQARTHLGDAAALAATSSALAKTAGLLAQCAVRRTPVLLDGSPLVCGAALVAEQLAPGACAWWLAGQQPPNPAAARALVELGLAPLLDLHLALPLGAELALSVLVQSVEHLRG
ncbi:MAG: nicotinate-nucleotide--dimethylbenzimidazole phosphoribosyltransferase [Frankiales bacterium]|nr:nicotinate-nucleotide--dimethylbenzimidazole phosphoribosyltransferase [Frankiales bacterium]